VLVDAANDGDVELVGRVEVGAGAVVGVVLFEELLQPDGSSASAAASIAIDRFRITKQ
jgi:hypothetical protein